MTLTVHELSLYLGVSESSLRQLVRENKIPYFKVGSKILFYEEDIIKFIRSQYQTS